MSDISGESTGADVPVCAKCVTPFDLYGAIALLYGYWLYRTGGVKERRTTTETTPDGTTTETEVTTNYTFTNPLSEIFRRLGW